VVFDEAVDEVLRSVCVELADRYELRFVEIGLDKDQVHFLVQSVPSYSPTKIVRTIKSVTAREIFKRVPAVKRQLWGGEFWSDGYYMATVGQHVSEDVIRQYVKSKVAKTTTSRSIRSNSPSFSSCYPVACRGVVHFIV
jgi:putative transposase